MPPSGVIAHAKREPSDRAVDVHMGAGFDMAFSEKLSGTLDERAPSA